MLHFWAMLSNPRGRSGSSRFRADPRGFGSRGLLRAATGSAAEPRDQIHHVRDPTTGIITWAAPTTGIITWGSRDDQIHQRQTPTAGFGRGFGLCYADKRFAEIRMHLSNVSGYYMRFA